MGHLSLKRNYNTMVEREIIIYNVVKGSKPNFKKILREGGVVHVPPLLPSIV